MFRTFLINSFFLPCFKNGFLWRLEKHSIQTENRINHGGTHCLLRKKVDTYTDKTSTKHHTLVKQAKVLIHFSTLLPKLICGNGLNAPLSDVWIFFFFFWFNIFKSWICKMLQATCIFISWICIWSAYLLDFH